MRQTVSPKGTAAVVDGCQVLLTPLQRAVVPPPMCAVAATFHQPVQCLAFGEHAGHEVRRTFAFAAAWSEALVLKPASLLALIWSSAEVSINFKWKLMCVTHSFL